jgi:hypothetical protein
MDLYIFGYLMLELSILQGKYCPYPGYYVAIQFKQLIYPFENIVPMTLIELTVVCIYKYCTFCFVENRILFWIRFKVRMEKIISLNLGSAILGWWYNHLFNTSD